MNEITTETSTETYSGHRLWRSLLYALLFAPVLAGVAIYLFWTGTLSMTNENGLTKVTREVSLKTLEEQFGVRIRLLGVTASGGMIDLRYKVLDKEKAKFLLGEENTISLDIENGMTLTPDTSGHKMKHNDRLEDGMIYFHMYPNTQNAVKPGTNVSIVFGSIRLEPIAAQ